MTYRFDALNRMTAKIVPERSGLTPAQTRDVHYAYDLRGLQTEARFDGLDGEGVSNVHDGFGRLVSTRTIMGGFARTVSHEYDDEGFESQLAFPDGETFWTSRDGLGRPRIAYQGPSGDTAMLMAILYHDAASNLYYLGRRWGSATSIEHDGLGRPLRVEDAFADAASGTVSNFAYNPAGQLRSETRTNDSYAWTESVATHRNYAANGLNQYVGTSTGAEFAYDPNGNLISSRNSTWWTDYTYDVENRLVAASGTHKADLTYDPLGRLFQVSSPTGATTQFLHDGDELVAEYNGSGALLRRYIHGDGSDDPLYWYEGPGLDQPRFPHSNRQGSIVAVAGPGGTRLWKNTYDEYGIPGAGNQGRFQYTGQAWIEELGLYYYKARFYSAHLGRFLQVDPIGYEDQINLYAYVGNDPVNMTDPSGLEAGCVHGPSQCGGRELTLEQQERREQTVGALTGLATFAVGMLPAGRVLGVASKGWSAFNAWRFTRTLSSAFKQAAAGGRHSGFLGNYVNRTIGEIRSGVKSIEREIADHYNKIADPASYVRKTSGRDWTKIDPREQAGMINKWKEDINRQKQQRDILSDLARVKEHSCTGTRLC